MDKILSSLQKIAVSLEKTGRDLRHEEQVYKAELEDRLSKKLTGDDAIQHYNDWMEAAEQSHLKITNL